MKIARATLLLTLFSLFWAASPPVARAQDEPSAAWLATRYDLTASPSVPERSLNVTARLTVRNVGRGAGSRITLRLSPRAEIKDASAGGAAATFRSRPEPRTNLQAVSVNLPAAAAPGSTVEVTLSYRLPLAENSGLAALSPAGMQFLPLSYWYPTPNTLYSLRGADTAPFTLRVEGSGTAVSSGVPAQPRNAASVYEQKLSAQPFFVEGEWDISEGAGEAAGISIYLPKGASAEERKQGEALVSLAAAARAFYAGLLGSAPAAPIRLISVTRGAGFDDAGALLFDAAALRRTRIDSVTALQVAGAVAHLWIGGTAPLRGEGSGVIREGLTRYLSALFFEKQFGTETAEAEKLRERVAYAAISRRDAPLALTTPLDGTYYTSVTNKGAMVWRLAERALGRDALMGLLRAALQAGGREAEGLTLASLRAAMAERGGAGLKSMLDQQLDQPTDMDLLVGLPQQRGGQWVVALRNTGAVDAAVTVLAVTATGERLTAQATIPARNFGEAVFTTQSKLARVEVDPDKLYPQLDYTNDVAPRSGLTEDALAEATALFARQNYAGVETTARELLARSPRMQEARLLLARSLLALNRLDEAEKEFRAALDERLPLPVTLAWANIGLAELGLRKGQAAEAARRFNEAVRADADYASTLAARLGRIKAEAAANAAPAPDESARAFIAQFDQAIKSGRKTELDALIVPGELTDFVRGIVGSQPESWQTRVLRTEQLDATRLAADVSINARQFGRDQSGTAVLVLRRIAGAWKLAAIDYFEVR